MKDEQYSAEKTRIFLDIFVHQEPYAPSYTLNLPFIRQNMRLPFGENCVLGPHRFQDLVRSSDLKTEFFATLRFGYCEMKVDDACYFYCPLASSS